MTGQLHRTSLYILSWIFFRLGSIMVPKVHSRCTATKKAGRPKTAKALEDHPSATPLTSKWVAMVSGRRDQRARPNKMGKAVMMVVRIKVPLFRFSMVRSSFQFGKPEHHFLHHGGVQLIKNKVLLPALKHQSRLF